MHFATHLSACPPAATTEDVQALRSAGLGQTEMLDLVLAVSIFGWSNRLMHTLGEPVAPAPG